MKIATKNQKSPLLAFGLLTIVFISSLTATPLLPQGDSTIVTFGDSTTAPRGGVVVYSKTLRKTLPSHGITGKVINKGVGGNTTSDGIARFEADVLQNHPDLVIIQFGINDSKWDLWKNPPTEKPRVDVQAYTSNLTRMVQWLKNAGVKVVLMTPNPMRWTEKLKGYLGGLPYDINDPMGLNATIGPYCQAVRQLAAAESVPLIDVYKMYLDYDAAPGQSMDDLLLDGEHPNSLGQQMVANALVDVITDITTPPYELKREEINLGGKANWFQPRPTPIPGLGKNGGPAVVMTIQKTKGSDHFTGLEVTRTDDLGKSWSKLQPMEELGCRDAGNGITVGICDFTLGWHAPTGKVLGIGHTARYTKKGFVGLGKGQRRDTIFSVYDPKTEKWTPWEILEFPKTEDGKYSFNGTHGQWLVEPDGTILVPIYFIPAAKASWKTSFIGVVARCKFDGKKLTLLELGNELEHPVPRGLYEKSITYFQGRYYMTIRNDKKAFVAVSDDGLHFGPIKPWTFDDGSDLGSYNTQQKWVTHSDGLFLVYTRRGANNDEVFRHRAPLLMAQVDPEKLYVIRHTEQVVVPKRGKACFGNFDATTINENETWITTAGGGKGFCTRVIWSKPNHASNQATK